MNFILAAFTTLLIAVFAAAFAAPYVVDWNAYRAVFEAQASKLVGRPVRVEGDVDLTILPVPEVRFKRVRIESLDGDAQRPFAQARAFKMVLSLAPLLRGQLEARKVELDRPVINLRYGDDGRGNWEGLGRDAAALPFMPQQVSLKSVSVERGIITLTRPDGRPVWQMEEVTGELSAESLSGPFRFTGTTLMGEGARDLRINIGRRGADESFPLRATLEADGTTYQADGVLRGAHASPVFDGMFTATTPAEEGVGEALLPLFEAKATGSVGLEAAEFPTIEIAIARQQRQQTITGSAGARWDLEPVIEASLGARWLDLDLLAGAQQGASAPAHTLARLPDLLAQLPITAARARISADFQQVSLGGDLIRDLKLSARLNAGGWAVEHIEAGLPGESEFRFSGRFTRDTDDVLLTGDFSASSRNLSRLMHWAMPADFAAETGPARSLSVSGDVSAAPDHFRIDQLSAHIGDSRLRGMLDMRRGDEPRFDVSLAAGKLDLRNLIAPGQSGALLTALIAGVSGEEGETAGEDAASTASSALAVAFRERLRNDPFSLNLRVGHLWLPEIRLTDVSADLSRRDGALNVTKLEMKGPGGLALQASGRYDPDKPLVANHAQFALASEQAEPLAQLLTSVPFHQAPGIARLRDLVPLRLAGVLRPVHGEDGVSVWRVDGVAAGSELAISARTGPAADAGLQLSAVARNPDSRGLLVQFFPALNGWLGAAEDQQPGYLTFDLESPESAGAQASARTDISFTAGDLVAEYRGALDLSWQLAPREGRFSLTSGSLHAALRIAGLSPPASSADSAFSMSAMVRADALRYDLGDLEISTGAEKLGGSLSLDLGSAVPALDVALSGDRVSLPIFANLLLEPQNTAIGEAAAIISDNDGFWPEWRFSPSALDGIRATIALDAATMQVADTLELGEAKLAASLADGALSLSSLRGELYGGAVKASGRLERERGRLVLRGRLEMDELDLSLLPKGPGSEPLASGRADLNLSLAGEGVSPSGLVASLSGEGRLSLGAGRVRGLGTSVLAQKAQDYFEAAEPQEDSITGDLAQALRQSEFRYRRARTGLVLEGGTLRSRELILRPRRGRDRAGVRAFVDLASMGAQLQWDLRAVAPDNLRLPAVRLTFAGPLVELGTMEPQLSAEEFEQFLIVRRLERDVERLERLRPLPPAQIETTPPQAAQPQLSRPPSAPGDPASSTAGQPGPQPPASGFATQIETVPARTAPSAPAVPEQAAPIELDPDLVINPPDASQQPAAQAPGASAEAPAESQSDAVPSRSLDDPRVVEDARRQIMRDQPQQERRRTTTDPFSSIFSR